jgi:hypothetical protein
MGGRQDRRAAALPLAVVSVALAAAGHSLGRGHALDPSSALVAAVGAGVLGATVARTWTLPRLLPVIAAVQLVVHSLAGAAADPRLVLAAPHGHEHAIVAAPTGSPQAAMLVWHLIAVPVTALLLAALARSAQLVSGLLRRWLLAVPVELPAPAPAARARRRVRIVRPRRHLVVSWSNAPPCPA